jgi:hypothetical protein
MARESIIVQSVEGKDYAFMDDRSDCARIVAEMGSVLMDGRGEYAEIVVEVGYASMLNRRINAKIVVEAASVFMIEASTTVLNASGLSGKLNLV